MTTRVTEGASRERLRFSPSFLASRGSRLRRSTLARTCTPLTKSEEKKRDRSQSKQRVNFQPLLTAREFLGVIMDEAEYINGSLFIVGWGRD